MRLAASVASALVLSMCSGSGSAQPTEAPSAAPASFAGQTSPGLAASTPARASSPSPKRFPSAEELLADSFTAMQRVRSVKVAMERKGRSRFATGRGVADYESAITATHQYQSSPDHGADAKRADGEVLRSDDTRGRQATRLVQIGRLSYLSTAYADSSPSPNPSVPLWKPSLQKDAFVFPDATFGKFGQFWIQADEATSSSNAKLDGTEPRDGAEAYRVIATGPLKDAGLALLRGTYREAFWIAADTLLWLRWERMREYEDGARLTETLAFADYDVPNAIPRPVTNPSAVFVPGAASSSSEAGDLLVRICAGATRSRPDCGNGSRAMPGVELALIESVSLKISQVRTTDGSGTAVFESVPIYVEYTLRVGCSTAVYPSGFGTSVAAGVVMAGGRTELPLAVC